MHINPYLGFDGNAAEALRHYAQVLGGELTLITFRGSPVESHFPPEHLDRIMHGRLTAPGLVLMASDAPGGRHQAMQGMRVSVNVDATEEAERIWNGLAEGAEVTMPLAETFWAERFGMLTDRFGTPWMVNCEKPPG